MKMRGSVCGEFNEALFFLISAPEDEKKIRKKRYETGDKNQCWSGIESMLDWTNTCTTRRIMLSGFSFYRIKWWHVERLSSRCVAYCCCFVGGAYMRHLRLVISWPADKLENYHARRTKQAVNEKQER